MAVDFFIMPISRYVPGAFITPAMRYAWAMGLPYTLVGQITRQIPPEEPFGGPDAFRRRQAYLDSGLLTADLAKYPAPICNELWDEASSAEPRFHRVDPTSYAALLDESTHATVETTSTSLFALRKRRTSHRSHLAAEIFLPVAFEAPFTTTLVLDGWLAGSVPTALGELERPASPETQLARATLRDALHDAAELRLPLLVDR